MSSALNSVFGGGNILGAALSIAGIAFPPLGIATSLAGMVTQAVGGAVNQAAQQLVKDCGMPKFVADIVGKVVDQALGQLKQATDPRCDDRCGGDKGVENTLHDFVQGLVKDLGSKCKGEIQNEGKSGKGGKEGAGSLGQEL